jgi:hypothetical protein
MQERQGLFLEKRSKKLLMVSASAFPERLSPVRETPKSGATDAP